MNLLAPRDSNTIKRLKALPWKEFSVHDYNNTNIKSLKMLNRYMRSNLGDDFEPALGTHHVEMAGKYRKSQVYFFEFEGHEIACVIEKGDRGTGWFLISDQDLGWGVLNIANPPLQGWFPRFLCELHQQVYGAPLLAEAFTGANYHIIKAMRDKEALTEHTPASSKKAAVKKI